MAPIQQSTVLEQPYEVDVASIEHELALLWKRATESPEEETQAPVVRACTMNLVVLTEDVARLRAVEQLVGEVTLEHPARIFLIHAERAAARAQLDAWISARCAIPMPGEKQVCCEQITLHADGAETTKVPSIVASLLIPDIPTVLLWKGDFNAADPLLSGLSELVDRILIDTSEEPEPVALLRLWSAFVDRSGAAMIPGDLAWSHITPWRSALAQVFAPPEARVVLPKISSIAIAVTTSAQPVHTGVSQALLLVSWLADRLRWSVKTPVSGNAGRGYSARLAGPGGPIAISTTVRSVQGTSPGGIEEISITTVGDISIVIASGEERSCIRSTVVAPDGHRKESVLWARDRDEVSVVARELEVLQHDPVYGAAVHVLRNLLGGV